MDQSTWFLAAWWVLGMACWFLQNRAHRSKVKVKNPWKYAFSGPILVTVVMCGTIQDQGGSGRVLLAACQLILATCQKLENDRRPHLDRFSGVGKLPVWLARCQIWKKSQAEALRDSPMRGVHLDIYFVITLICINTMILRYFILIRIAQELLISKVSRQLIMDFLPKPISHNWYLIGSICLPFYRYRSKGCIFPPI